MRFLFYVLTFLMGNDLLENEEGQIWMYQAARWTDK